MGRERIDPRNTGHGSHKGGSDRPPGAHQISMIIGIPHQLLCDNIHNRKTIAYDRIKLPVQTVFNDLWQIRSVDLMGLIITDLRQDLV